MLSILFVSLTILLIFDDSVLIRGSSRLVTRNASRSSASLAASVGKFGLTSGIYLAGIYLLAASVIFFRKCFSPIWCCDNEIKVYQVTLLQTCCCLRVGLIMYEEIRAGLIIMYEEGLKLG